MPNIAALIDPVGSHEMAAEAVRRVESRRLEQDNRKRRRRQQAVVFLTDSPIAPVFLDGRSERFEPKASTPCFSGTEEYAPKRKPLQKQTFTQSRANDQEWQQNQVEAPSLKQTQSRARLPTRESLSRASDSTVSWRNKVKSRNELPRPQSVQPATQSQSIFYEVLREQIRERPCTQQGQGTTTFKGMNRDAREALSAALLSMEHHDKYIEETKVDRDKRGFSISRMPQSMSLPNLRSVSSLLCKPETPSAHQIEPARYAQQSIEFVPWHYSIVTDASESPGGDVFGVQQVDNSERVIGGLLQHSPNSEREKHNEPNNFESDEFDQALEAQGLKTDPAQVGDPLKNPELLAEAMQVMSETGLLTTSKKEYYNEQKSNALEKIRLDRITQQQAREDNFMWQVQKRDRERLQRELRWARNKAVKNALLSVGRDARERDISRMKQKKIDIRRIKEAQADQYVTESAEYIQKLRSSTPGGERVAIQLPRSNLTADDFPEEVQAFLEEEIALTSSSCFPGVVKGTRSILGGGFKQPYSLDRVHGYGVPRPDSI